MSNKQYYVDGELYNVDDQHEEEFLQEHSNAKLKQEDKIEYDVDGTSYKVSNNDQEEFLKTHPNASQLSGKQQSSVKSASTGQSPQSTNKYDGTEYASDGILSDYQLNNNSKDFNIDFAPMPEITRDITGVREEKAIKELQDKWMEYGFSFEQKTFGLDRIEVTDLNGDKETFNLGGFKGTQEEEAKRMDAWMRERAEHQGDKLESFLAHVNVKQDQIQNIAPDQKLAQTQIDQLREAWGLQGYSDDEVLKEYDSFKRNKNTDTNLSIADARMGDPTMSNWKNSDTYKDYINKKSKIDGTTLEKDFKKNRTNLDVIVKGKESYKEQEALKQYENIIKQTDKDFTIDGMYDENGLTEKGSKILNSNQYKNIYNSIKVDKDKEQEYLDGYFKQDQMNKYLESNLKDQIQNFSNKAFVKSDTQKELLEMAKEKQKNLSDQTKEKVNKFNIVYGDLENIYNESNGLADWLNSKGDGTETVEQIKAKYDLTTQDGVDAAQAELDVFRAEYLDKREKYDFLQTKKTQYESFANKIGDEIDNVDESELSTVIDALDRNYQQGTVMAGNLANSVIDLGQGAINFGDFVLSAPRQLIREIDNPGVSAFFNVASDVDPELKERGIDKANKWVDNWQKETITNRIEKPTQFKDIKSLSDFGEWSSTAIATQIPILASMWATGGASLYFMGATSAGSKFQELQNSKKEYLRTGGLYGNNYSWGDMFLNAGLTGFAEAASERITLGQVNKLKKVLANNPAAKLGFASNLKKNVFTFNNLRAGATDVFQEGASESIAQLSSNFLDIAIGDKEVNIYDGVLESFATGALISQSMKIPTLGKMMSMPFRSADTNQQVGEIATQLENLQKRADKLDPNSKAFNEIESEIVSLVEKSNRLINQDIKKVNLLNDGEKKALINIEKQNFQARKRAEEIMLDEKLTDKQKDEQIKYLQSKVDMRAKTKNDILGRIKDVTVNENYKREMDVYGRMVEKSKEFGSVEIKIEEVDAKTFTDIGLQDDGIQMAASKSALESLLRSDADATTKQDAINKLNSNNKKALEYASTYGMMIPQFENGNLKSMRVIVNKDSSLKDGKLNTKTHEFLHAMMYNTIQGDPVMRERLGARLDKIIRDGKIRPKTPSANLEYTNRIALYDKSEKGEEKLAIISEMLRDGKLEIAEGTATKFKDFFRRYYNNFTGKDIEFNETQDVLNFIKDYDYNIRNNIASPAMSKLLQRGANGRIFQDPRDNAETKREKSFSRAVDLNRRSNPDLKREFDQFVQNSDGSKKYPTNEMFKDSPDFTGAYLNILEGRALDALIAQGMTERGLPPEAIREFTRKVKEELSRRFITNYNLDKNDSLFGWLAGVSGGAGRSIIYRAKGDVMNEYIKEQRADQTSIDKEIGEGTRLSDLIQDERDVLLESIENIDLSPGRRREVKNAINELKAKEILNFSQDTKSSISDAVVDANLPLEGLTYKGVKDYIISVDKKATTEKKVVPTGPLFPVLNAVSTEFGVDPLRILAKQDLNGEQRKAAQAYILDKSTNEDGSFNTALFDILPEGETRSGEATGIANTKLGQLYDTGDRLKVSEGASKSLGQKRSQTKRNNVSREEFLDLFGIEANGRLKPGTKADGAIRALVVATAQLAANQDMRISALSTGSATEAAAAALGDGKSVKMFSKAVSPENVETFETLFGEAVSSIGDVNLNDKKDILEMLRRVYKDTLLSDKELKGIANDWYNWNQKFESLQSTKNKDLPIDRYDAQTFIVDQTSRALLDTGLLNTFKDKFVTPVSSISSLYTKDRINKNRGNVVKLGNEYIDRGMSKQQVIRRLFMLKGMYQSSARISDKRFIEGKDGNVIENPDWTGTKVNKKGKTVKEVNRGQIFQNNQAYINKISEVKGLEDLRGKSWKQIAKENNVDLGPLLAETSNAAIKDKNYKARLAQAKEYREVVEDITKMYVNGIYNNTMQYEDLVLLGKMLGSDMRSPMKGAANLKYIAQGINNIPSDKRGKMLEYEHMVPTNVKIMEMFNALLTNPSGLPSNFFDDYNIAIIPKAMDKVLIKKSLRDFMHLGYKPGDPNFKRYYNAQTLGEKGLVPIVNIENGKVEGEEFVKLSNKLINKETVDNVINSQKMKSKAVPSPRGMSAFDFDETLIIEGDNFIIATNPNTNETERISSEDWPTRGTELMEQGYTFNFDDFINVRGGVEGPLFTKLKNRINKFGPENNFILTARPQQSAVAIHGWLVSKGIDIPLENITGLGNSSGDSKAQWILDKYQQGYNDIYFVDDALQNVTAVKHVMQQLDIKGSSVQARLDFNETSINKEFNDMIERDSGIKSEQQITEAVAKKLSIGKGRYDFFVPPSAEDFKGLLYRFLGKGKQGDKDMAFFKKVLLDPFAKGIRNYNIFKQNMSIDYNELKRTMPNVVKSFDDKVGDSVFTNEDAMRVYLWNKAGYETPGLSQEQVQQLVDHVNADPDLIAFADTLGRITKSEQGYVEPDINWSVTSIAGDLVAATKGANRQDFIQDFLNNREIIFSKDNLNKIQAVYGKPVREALENMLYRMEFGTNRTEGQDRTVNRFLNWINGSVGAVMFFNSRSSLLQTISTVNFINWEDNNMFAAARAFANQPQYWKDFAMIFNSPMLKQRRAGLQIDVNYNELSAAFKGGRSKPEAIIRYLLEKGFLPTQIADSFAISAGGATFYRNRYNKYIKEGLDPESANTQAFLDFQEIAEETQQSSRPDLISQQQASTLGRLILAWQNTPMQMTRLTKKALSDLVNGRGSAKANISRILYYGLIQNIIFGTLQTGLSFLLFGADSEEEDKKRKTQRVLNGALDTLLRGTGVWGAAVATIKNTIMRFYEERAEGWTGDQTYTILEAISLSPPIGSKARKIYKAIQTDKFNRGISEKLKYRIENPNVAIASNVIEAVTNFPAARLLNKANNIEEAITGQHDLWQRMALLGGWDMWSVGIKDEEVEAAKQEVKDDKKRLKDEKKQEDKRLKEEEKKKEQEKKKQEGIKQVRCSAVKSNGQRCKMMVETKNETALCMYHKTYSEKEEKEGVDRDNDGIKEFRCTAIKANGQQCKNRTENANKKCYAHQ